MAKLVITRHGITQYNLEKRFCGFVDVELPKEGQEQAHLVGKQLKALGIEFQGAYTSWLQRAQKTLGILLEELGQSDLAVIKHPFLNERHYGDLQGLLHGDMAKKVGDVQVQIWRRSYDVRPPNGESLEDVVHRAGYYLDTEILPRVKAGENILVCAHGNSNRAIVKRMENLSADEIVKREVPWDEFQVYEL